MTSFYKVFLCLVLIFMITSCHISREPHLQKLSPLDISFSDWTDDLDYQGLNHAAEQSLIYYERIPRTVTFHYNDLIYSPEEMAASLKLFMDIVENYHGDELNRQIKEKFLFFESKNSDNGAFFTGYYEPVLDGRLEPAGEFTFPLYETPEDLIKVDLGKFNDKWQKDRIYGRIEDNRLVPYFSREEIVYKKSLENRARPIAYAKEIELFFLQIQGSGLVRLPDGTLKRVNYASQNGHPYRSIGKLLKDRIPEEEMSLQSLKSYLYNNPSEVRDILSYNQSYVFFREVSEGPLGYLDVPLTSRRSIAMDRKTIPAGGLAYIETKLPIFDNNVLSGNRQISRFVLVQDTGGAISGHGRVDIFLGHDKNSEMVAGHLKESGRVYLIVARKEFLDKFMDVKTIDNRSKLHSY